MTKRVVAHEYNHKWDEVAKATFEFVEDAQDWCESRSPEHSLLNWGDTQIGLEGNTIQNIDHLDSFGDYKPGEPIFQISAIRHENPEEIEELQCYHYDPKRMTDEDLKYAWEEATRIAEEDDEWGIVSVIENEVNKRNLNQKGGV